MTTRPEPSTAGAEGAETNNEDRSRLQGVFDGMWPMLQRYIEGDVGDIELSARLQGYFRRLREGDVVGAALAEAERHFEQCSEAFLDDRTTDAAYHVGCAREALRPLYRTPTIEEWDAVVRDQRRAMRDMGIEGSAPMADVTGDDYMGQKIAELSEEVDRLRRTLAEIHWMADQDVGGRGGPYWSGEDAASQMADTLRRIRKAARPDTEGGT